MTKQEILDKLRFDLELRNKSATTISDYVRRAKVFQDYYDKPADQMDESHLSAFLHFLLTQKKLKPSSVNTYNVSLRFLYEITLDVAISRRKVPRAKERRRIPDLPTKEELLKIFNCAPSLKYKTIFMTIYGSGLRLSEAANLRVIDIDSKNMRIFINGGKGDKDRYTLLPENTLLMLRTYYKQYKPQQWLFWTREKTKMSNKSIGNALRQAVIASGVQKHITVHTLRHCFATHLLMEGATIYEIKKLLGHMRIETTTWYLQLADSEMQKIKSPLDTMELENHV